MPPSNATPPVTPWQAAAAPTVAPVAAGGLDGLFDDDRGSQRMMGLLRDPDVSDVRCNRFDRIFFTDATGQKAISQVFAGPAQYIAWLDRLLLLTDVGYTEVAQARSSVIEGSFRADKTDVKGAVIITTSELTRREPAVVIRKQPNDIVTLDQMMEQGMMTADMRLFLQMAVQGRLNMMISGGSGAGKTTLARALSWYVDPNQRVITIEEIDELHLDDRLPNVVALTTYRHCDDEGRVVREEDLDALVRHALRMRGDRIWVGEVRGREAYALVKACLSGHDGSVTTIHANDASQAIRQLVTYTMEAGVPEEVARDQVSSAFHIGVQISRVRLGRRAITEIMELQDVREGSEQRRNTLWRYDFGADAFQVVGEPSKKLKEALARNNVNFSDLTGMYQQP